MIRSVAANKYHNPWRATAGEIHPVAKLEVLDENVLTTPAPSGQPSARPVPPTPSVPAQEFITLTRPVTMKIPYGETILPRGLKLPVVSRSGNGITVQYLGKAQTIPANAAAPL